MKGATTVEIILTNDGLGIQNYSALVQYAKEATAVYDGLVVEEAALAGAKRDAASLRKQAKEADRIRIEIKKQNEQRIKEVVDQLYQVAAIFNGSADRIASQVKEFEDRNKKAKKDLLMKHFEEVSAGTDIEFDDVFDSRMLNKTYDITDAVKEIDRRISEIKLSPKPVADVVKTVTVMNGIPVFDCSKVLEKDYRVRATEKKLEALENWMNANGYDFSQLVYKLVDDDPDSIFGD